MNPITAPESVTMPAAIVKREGHRAVFNASKIASAIQRAGAATGELDATRARVLTIELEKTIAARFGRRAPHVEEIQDLVEMALIAAGHVRTARAYIVHREKHARLRGDHRTNVDVAASVDEYQNREDWLVNANANKGYSLGGLILIV